MFVLYTLRGGLIEFFLRLKAKLNFQIFPTISYILHIAILRNNFPKLNFGRNLFDNTYLCCCRENLEFETHQLMEYQVVFHLR